LANINSLQISLITSCKSFQKQTSQLPPIKTYQPINSNQYIQNLSTQGRQMTELKEDFRTQNRH